MPVNEQIVDSVAMTNVKTIAEQPAVLANLALSNAVSHQQQMNQIQTALTAQAVNKLVNLDMMEAAAESKVSTGNDLAQQIAQLLASMGANQQATKTAQTTPPVTP